MWLIHARAGRLLAMAGLAGVLGAAAVACGGDDNAVSLDTEEVTLDEVNQSGFEGEALLAGTEGGTTAVVVSLGTDDGLEGDFPAAIHRGTCEGLTGTEAFDLGSMQGGFLSTEVDIALDTLTSDDHAVVIYQSDDRSVYVACGDL